MSGWYDVFERVGGVALHDWQNVDSLLDWRDTARRNDPAVHWLFVLDDPGQASYTSNHATGALDIGQFREDELPDDDRVAFEGFFLPSPRIFIERAAAQIAERAQQASLPRQQLLPFDAAEIELPAVYGDPSLVFGSPAKALRVPVPRASLGLAGLPNGYFNGDLNPFENYALAQLLYEQFDLELIGLGSYLIAFIRQQEFDRKSAEQVLASVRHLYMDFSDEVFDEYCEALTGRRWLLLHYRGS